MIQVKIKVNPLSINQAFQGKRFKTSACKKYEQELLTLMPEKKMIEGRNLKVEYTIGLKYPLKSDLGNYEKLLTDIIVKKGWIKDDRYIFSLIMKKVQSDFPFAAIKIYEQKSNNN